MDVSHDLGAGESMKVDEDIERDALGVCPMSETTSLDISPL